MVPHRSGNQRSSDYRPCWAAPRHALIEDIGFQVIEIGDVIRLAPEAECPRFFEGLVLVREQFLSVEMRRESAASGRELEFVPLARGNVDIFSIESGPLTVLHFVEPHTRLVGDGA